MTRIEELEQRMDEAVEKFRHEMNNCRAEIEQIKALAELKESKKEKWKPEKGEEFWYRTSNGETMWSSRGTADPFSEWKINNLPIFKTNEDCKRYWHFMDTVKEKSYEFTADEWKNDELFKFWIDCDCTTDTFHVLRAFVAKGVGTVYFKSPDDAEYIINNFKDELLTYWL